MVEQKQRREHAGGGTWPFSSYKRFWRGCKWEIFLRPSPAGFSGAKAEAAAPSLQPLPGCYEFAISTPESWEKRVKVYVGESGSLQHRHQLQYFKDGGHLRAYLDQALQDGCVIWRRCRYVSSKETAVQWEARWLARYDYAWNYVGNGPKRVLQLRQHFCCFCVATGIDVVPQPALPSQQPGGAGGSGRRLSPSKQRTPGKAVRQQQQQQFVVRA